MAMKTVLQRVCWNTRGWQMPSGNAAHEKGYPSEAGFGHEEWNFQLDDAFEKWLHGYMYTRPKDIEQNEVFRLIFFAIHPDTKSRLVVGIYHAAEVIPVSSYDGLFLFFEREHIFERRAIELSEATSHSYEAALTEVKKAVSEHWLSVRCPVSRVQIPYPYPLLGSVIGLQSYTNRFRMFTYLDDASASPINIPGSGRYGGTEDLLPEDAYPRESPGRLKIIQRQQNKLANAFCSWLKEHHGIIGTKEKYHIDVAFEINNNQVMAELKISYGVGVTKSIREALGQILEYNCYPLRKFNDIWLIVLDAEPSDFDKEFVTTLRDKWSLPLTIGWRTEQAFEFFPNWPG